eukprot:504390_1
MAEAEGSSTSSDESWFEPDDLNISTTQILEQQRNQTQTTNQPSLVPLHETEATATKNKNDEPPNSNENDQNDDTELEETPTTPSTTNPHNDPMDRHQPSTQTCSDHAASKDCQQNHTSSPVPHALKQAYNKMIASNDDTDSVSPYPPKSPDDNPNPKIEYDIDNLPIQTSEKPVLSLHQLRQSTSSHTNNNHQSNTKTSATKHNKYANFFARNFFIKKAPNVERKNSTDEDMNDADEHKQIAIDRIRIKGNTKEKELSDLRLTQKIENAHKGAIYCMEFSKKGDYLATGGQDSVLRIWTVCGSRADMKRWEKHDGEKDKEHMNDDNDAYEHEYNFDHVLSVVAYREFTGHRADIIDISWSNGEFILSASIDQTVMLWHTSRTRCLCLFQHSDIVTSVTFHPNEDYLFLSGSFDSRLRLWNILEHRVVDWVQVPTLVTCTTFSVNGKFAIAGLYDGQCFFYSTQGHRLKYVTAIECRNSSGKYRKGRKVTGLQYMPHSHADDMKNIKNMEHGSPQLLISTNDSRLRLYNLSNFDMQCKYKGHENTQSQIHGRFSPDGKLIVCGSEDNNIYLWRVEKAISDESNSIFQSKKSKNRQEYYEYFKSNCKLPQVALFAPHRSIHYVHKFKTIMNKNASAMYKNNEDKIKHIILTADTEGHIHIYTNHSKDKKYKYPYHHHHSHSATVQ